MRGASFLVAVTFAAEIGDVRRFDTPRQLMSFLGLVPAESRPIDENTAKAIEESAKALCRGLVLLADGALIWLELGGVPENLIGLLIGDWLIHKRGRRWSELTAETRRILDEGTSRSLIRMSVRPSRLIEAALDEDREGLKDPRA